MMTADEFRSRYQLLKRVTEAGVGTFHAVGPGGAVVMVHVFTSPDQAKRTEEAAERLLPVDRTRILETLDVEGSPVLVTKFLLDFVSLESWFDERLAAAEAEGYTPEAVPEDPAAASLSTATDQSSRVEERAEAGPSVEAAPPPVTDVPAPHSASTDVVPDTDPVAPDAAAPPPPPKHAPDAAEPPSVPLAPSLGSLPLDSDPTSGPVTPDSVLPTLSQEAASQEAASTPPPLVEADATQGADPPTVADDARVAGAAADVPPPAQDAPAAEGGLTAAFAAFQEVGEPAGTEEPAETEPPVDIEETAEVHEPADVASAGSVDPVDVQATGVPDGPTEAPAVEPSFPGVPDEQPTQAPPIAGVPGGLTAAFEAFTADEESTQPPATPDEEAEDLATVGQQPVDVEPSPPPPPAVVEPSAPPVPPSSAETSAPVEPPPEVVEPSAPVEPPPPAGELGDGPTSSEGSDTGSFTGLFDALQEPESQDLEPPSPSSRPTVRDEPPVVTPPEVSVPEPPPKPEKGEFTQLFEAFGDDAASEPSPETPTEGRTEPAPAPEPDRPQPPPPPPEPVLGSFRIEDTAGIEPPSATEEPVLPPAPGQGVVGPKSGDAEPSAPRRATPEPRVPPAETLPGTGEPPLPGPRVVLPWEEQLPLDDPSSASEPSVDPERSPSPPSPPPPLPPHQTAGPPPPTGPGPLTRQFELGSRHDPAAGAGPRSPDHGLFGDVSEERSGLGGGSGLPEISSDYLERLRSRDEPGHPGDAAGRGPPPPPLATGGGAAAGAGPSVTPSGGRKGPSEYSQIIKAIPFSEAPPESPSGPPGDGPPGALAQGPSRRLVIGVVVAAVLISLMTLVALVVWRFAGPSIRRLMDEPPAQDSASTPDETTGS